MKNVIQASLLAVMLSAPSIVLGWGWTQGFAQIEVNQNLVR